MAVPFWRLTFFGGKVTSELNRKTLSKCQGVNERSEVRKQNYKLHSEKQISPLLGTLNWMYRSFIRGKVGNTADLEKTFTGRKGLIQTEIHLCFGISFLYAPDNYCLLTTKAHSSHILLYFLLNGSSWTHLSFCSLCPLLLATCLARDMPIGSVGNRAGSKC